MAGQIGIKQGRGTVGQSETITLELGSGILFFTFTGAAYSYVYKIDFWHDRIIDIGENRTDIKVEKLQQSRKVNITNESSDTQLYNFVFIG